MRTYVIDCAKVLDEPRFWQIYLETTRPEGASDFGRNRAAFRDAVLGGGPGWPGECTLVITNAAGLLNIDDGRFRRFLDDVAAESSEVRIRFE